MTIIDKAEISRIISLDLEEWEIDFLASALAYCKRVKAFNPEQEAKAKKIIDKLAGA